MLIRYKKTYEKIAMGLLSYMPEDQSVKALQETIQQYETDDSWELYLWKDGEDFIGLLGIEMGNDVFTLQHLSVNPSFRGEGFGKEMVKAIQSRYPEKKCQSTEITEAFLKRCMQEESGGADH
ncbi:GNAT family N-acetyltransferase [Sporosarcina ureilytica]|uniref:GNAT family N-acetyltransferase n=1 Tax=Sporosarcina ureilytica TaxID=298596 RepID=A0A1D8JHA6_9BACL|nr:GNAT family N-acetyltransferase [Sporosarcina ureilytica]AOV08102.1 GNAT family N-acetyltransferase [Sporosarcina ureilytica]